ANAGPVAPDVPKEEPLPTPSASTINNNQLPPSVADLVSSFEITKERSLKIKDDPSHFQLMLETSYEFIPEALDAERPKYYAPANPYPVPAYYPQSPLPIFENHSVYEELDVDTLFFIFYYQQGTFQQYLAARELRRQSWRYHKRFHTWFQRFEEPTEITEEYEAGAYVYFDFQGGWCQRKKNSFKFEYKWLEDEELSFYGHDDME
ncbi:general negative regulator of transcription subunit 5, partial [Irineochytrium annulatum]